MSKDKRWRVVSSVLSNPNEKEKIENEEDKKNNK